MKKAIYAVSGDPIHKGHIDIVQRTVRVFDKVVLGIGLNPDKKCLFTLEERLEMARRSLSHVPNVEVVSFQGLLVDYAYEQGIGVIVKGVRNSNDFDYENILHLVGESQELGIDTFFLFARPELMHVSSTTIKALQKEEGFIHYYVPLYVKQCLEARISGQYSVGVTGEIGCGKTRVSEVFREVGKSRGLEVHTLELDQIGYQILEELTEPSYHQVREKIAEAFGRKVRNADGTINRKKLGEIVYRSPQHLEHLNRILERPLMVRLRRELRNKQGLILLNAALMAESNLTHLCNNNVVLVTCDKKSQEKRLLEMGFSRAQIRRRLASQYSSKEKKDRIHSLIRQENQGKLWVLDNSEPFAQEAIPRVFEKIISCFGLAGPAATLLLALLLAAALWFPCPPAAADTLAKIDERSGISWEKLLKGEIPENLFWEFIEPQRDYLRSTYGPGISTTYELYLREMERLNRPEPAVAEDPRVLEIKTLKRWPDPVVLHGRDLPGCEGRPLEHFRLYALHLGKFVPVPYQFDEITPDGRKVLPDGGPEANPEEGNGRLDARDELLFMAHDLGDRVRPADWVGGFDAATEISARDPLDSGRGWCYLLSFPRPPPPSPLNYATYVDKYNQHYGFYLFEQSQFKVHQGKLYRQIFNQAWKLPDYAGGDFTNFIDRLKFRVRVRLLFGSLKITTTEDDVSGDTLALRDGPVRCTRRCWGRVQLPLGFKTPRIVSDIIGYDTMFVCPVILSVPINPGLVLTDLSLHSGTDLHPGITGSRWYNSNNLGGFTVDGVPTEEERTLNETLDDWRLVTGAWGTMMNRSLWDPGFLQQAEIRIRFTDDVRIEDRPEYFPGQFGMAYNISTVRNLKPGRYLTELDWFFIPWFNPPERTGELNREKVNQYLDMVERPLELSAGGPWFPNEPRPRGPHPAEEPKHAR